MKSEYSSQSNFDLSALGKVTHIEDFLEKNGNIWGPRDPTLVGIMNSSSPVHVLLSFFSIPSLSAHRPVSITCPLRVWVHRVLPSAKFLGG